MKLKIKDIDDAENYELEDCENDISNYHREVMLNKFIKSNRKVGKKSGRQRNRRSDKESEGSGK